ncbi:hypothetical protein EDM68_00895 [Candidatus Uhrbacteria bacterium]|nr:MAG: hypothetical protein EDM68_00895 [Candidatus Uhrbacteria bacterium]
MLDQEDDLLVYFAGPAAARPDRIPEFRIILSERHPNPSPDFLEALEHVAYIVEETHKACGWPPGYFMFRRELCKRCRDFKVVSGSSPEFPLNAAKMAILTANDY